MKIKKLLAIWWVRIASLLLIFYAINEALGFIFNLLEIPNVYYYEPTLVFSILIASILIEASRAESKAILFGIQINKTFLKDIFIGFIIVLFAYTVILITRYFTNSVFTINPEFSKELFYKTIFICLFVAIYEEIFARGVLFQTLISRFGIYTASIAVSIVFAILHIFNPKVTVVSFVVTFTASIILCAMYVQTKSLWMPISFHFFWNLLQVLFLDSNISGIYYTKYLLLSKQDNLIEKFVFGGEYGIEGGLLVLFLEIIILIYVIKGLKAKPEITASLYKRQLAESQLLEKVKK